MGFLGGPPGEDQAFLCGELLDCGGGGGFGLWRCLVVRMFAGAFWVVRGTRV